MLDFNDLLVAVKKSALEAIEAAKPVNVVYGKVTSVSPLIINIEQKLNLSEAQLVLTRSASELVTGDSVILLRVQGGQKYVVLDRGAS